MKPKEYLNQIRTLEYKIYIAEEEAQRIRDRLDLKGVSYEGDKVVSSPDDKIPELMSDLLEIEEKNELRRRQYEAFRSKILSQIEGLDDQLHMAILYQRYVKGLPLELIAQKSNYSYDRIRHLHGVALQHFGEKYSPLEKVSTF